MSEYTESPWGVFLNEDTNQFEIFRDEGRRFGPMLAKIVGTRGAFSANARLIAAAPEMYEELHTVSDWLATIAGEMDCTAGNFDGGSAASCEHCQWKQSLARIDALLLRAGGE